MGLWADWKEIRKKSKAAGFRRRINTLEIKRRAIQATQLRLTHQAELLEGNCAIHDGEPVLTSVPRILQLHTSKHASIQ